MRQAIITRFHGPTNSRGSRVSASSQAGRIYLSWDHALDSSANHLQAARFYAGSKGWPGRWYGGATPDGRGYCFVAADDSDDSSFRIGGE